MHRHPDVIMANKGWYKCPICGYCRNIEEETDEQTNN